MKKNESVTYSYQGLKRKIYLTSLPLVIIALVVAIIIERNQGMDFANKVSLPILLVWLLVFLTVVIFRKNISLMENITFIFLCLFHLYKFHFAINEGLGNGANDLDEYTFWIPLLFVFIFLIYRRKKGLLYSLIVYSLTVIVGVFYVFPAFTSHINELDTITQFYLSNLAYIIALFFLTQLIEVYSENEALQNMAYTDYLTKIPNRRKIEDTIQIEMKKAKKLGKPLSIILFDIDSFKLVNDRYGHDIGDIILKELADKIRVNLKANHSFGRWGGEEFLIIAPNQNKQQALKLANHLRSTIESCKFPNVDKITLSFGVTDLNNNDSSDSLFSRADQALYISKNSGKNQANML